MIFVSNVFILEGKSWVAFNQLQAGTGLIYDIFERDLRHERNIVNGGWQSMVVGT